MNVIITLDLQGKQVSMEKVGKTRGRERKGDYTRKEKPVKVHQFILH